MSELDHLREKVAYLKFWLGIFVVTGISLAGWLVVSSGIVILNRLIERWISRIKEL